MPRPRKSTMDEMLDQFASWPAVEQQVALAAMQALHRQTLKSEKNEKPVPEQLVLREGEKQ